MTNKINNNESTEAEQLIASQDEWAIFSSSAEYNEETDTLIFKDGSKVKTRAVPFEGGKTNNECVYEIVAGSTKPSQQKGFKMSLLSSENITQVASPVRAHEDNFELFVEIQQGNSLTKQNFSTALEMLEKKLKFSQHCESSIVKSFNIAKVIRDEDDNIVVSTLIISMAKQFKVSYKNGAEFFTDDPMVRLEKDQAFWDKQRAKGKPARNPRPEILKVVEVSGFNI
ncbi:MAG: hypothetical protein ACI88H_000093 [Cocleimonas sp.]|jgi:hypothetical protein